MSAMSNPTQSESSADPTPANPSVEGTCCSRGRPKKDRFLNGRSALGKRVLLALVPFPDNVCIGVAAPLLGSRMACSEREDRKFVSAAWLVGAAGRNELHAAVPTRSDWRRKLPLLRSAAVRRNVARSRSMQQSIDRIATNMATSQEQITSS